MANFGVCMFATDYAIGPIELARAVEERGLDSLFFPEHTHIPASRRSPYPGGGELPREYWHTYDPFIALAAAAAVTRRIRLGTGICLVVERDPIALAKEVASLDALSGGRVILGIGAGWNAEEMENHGVAFRDRWAVTREKVLAMKAIWTQDEAEFHGKHVNFDPIWSYPKPVQAGGPPIWLGANSRFGFERVVDYCDGWMPVGSPRPDGLASLRAAAQRAGRRFEDLTLALFAAPPERDRAQQLLTQGFTELIFPLPAAPASEILPRLDTYADLAHQLRS